MYTKDSCELCEKAKAELAPFSQCFNFQEVDITKPENSKWSGLYRYEIPVFHFQGKFLMKHRVDVEKLKTALDEFYKLNFLKKSETAQKVAFIE